MHNLQFIQNENFVGFERWLNILNLLTEIKFRAKEIRIFPQQMFFNSIPVFCYVCEFNLQQKSNDF